MTISVVSGYFNPLHVGHIYMIKEAKKLGDKLVVIVNNDTQQVLKKGKIIMDEVERKVIIESLRDVDEVILSQDEDATVSQTLKHIRKKFSDQKIIFCNGGDRNFFKDIPEAEFCEENGIEMKFGVGGASKANSSSNVNKLNGKE